jgi:hypothetical protein
MSSKVHRKQSLPDRHEWLFQYLIQINGKRRNCGIVATHPVKAKRRNSTRQCFKDHLQIDGSKAMESATFRKWLTERGCRFDRHDHEKRGEGQVIVTVHREGHKAEVPLGGSHQILDARVVRQACEELGLDWSQLPGPKGRV